MKSNFQENMYLITILIINIGDTRIIQKKTYNYFANITLCNDNLLLVIHKSNRKQIKEQRK